MIAVHKKQDLCKVVILVGDRDFGRCPVSSRMNRALWPVCGKSALQRLLEQLAGQNITRVVISCASQSGVTAEDVVCPPGMDVSFQYKSLPRGPAGCILDAAANEPRAFLVLPGNMLRLPPIRELLQKHKQSQADMTVFMKPGNGGELSLSDDSQIYMCEPTILTSIPQTGYFDLKEGLIPVSIQDGLTIGAASLPYDTGHYRTWSDYLAKFKSVLIADPDNHLCSGLSRHPDIPDVWVASNVRISSSARIYGPAVIGENAIIADDAMLFGPTVIGRDVEIGVACVIEESILWDKVAVAHGARIRCSLIDADNSVSSGSELKNALMPAPCTNLQKALNPLRQFRLRTQVEHQFQKSQGTAERHTLEHIFEKKSQKLGGFLLGLLLLGALIVSYWKPTLKSMVGVWLESDEYSSGLLVPVIVLYVIWLRRRIFGHVKIQPSVIGLGFLLLAQGIRFFGLYFMFSSIERFSFVMSIGAGVYCLLGWQFFKKFSPIFLFLFLMLPLPNRIESILALPLQAWATVSSVFCLETLGFSVIREGNVININGTLVAVAEACNGLRMLTAFIVVSGFVALTVNRKWPVKLILLLSSIPIALACNTLRLTITAMAFTKLDTERWEKVFHDFGGFAMMPVALLIIVFELWLLSRLIIEPKNKQEKVIYRKRIEST